MKKMLAVMKKVFCGIGVLVTVAALLLGALWAMDSVEINATVQKVRVSGSTTVVASPVRVVVDCE